MKIKLLYIALLFFSSSIFAHGSHSVTEQTHDHFFLEEVSHVFISEVNVLMLIGVAIVVMSLSVYAYARK